MNEFENKLIKEEAYDNGFFPRIPAHNKRGSAFILANGCEDNIIVDDKLTIRQIRRGKYSLLVEISILPYVKEICISSPSRDAAYPFDVNVKAVIQVDDPLVFYENKNIDVDAYFDNILLSDVRRVTSDYSILNYRGMDDALVQQFSASEIVDREMGFSYKISSIMAQTGEQSKEYIKRYGKQRLDAELKEAARNQKNRYSFDLEDILLTQVAEGEKSELEARMEYVKIKDEERNRNIEYYEKVRDKGLMTEKDVREKFRIETNQSEGIDTQNRLQSANGTLRDYYQEEE